ncbi:hypothetical protein AX16_005755 [Volvariella volvacea WC 439]|nr:hypothetical protein AX16_005755 [Volvariella volvacea WC 439]
MMFKRSLSRTSALLVVSLCSINLGSAFQIPILSQRHTPANVQKWPEWLSTGDTLRGAGGGSNPASTARRVSTSSSLNTDQDLGLFTPTESLSAVSEVEYTTLSHPLFPQYNVRVKKSNFCDGGVSSYTGYIDIQARHLFFYFFESRNDPDHDDVIFWTNGGPGCSSSLGLFMELGPCRVLDENGPKYHPESWNENANIFFIDQPVGVGFSYAEYGEAVGTTEEAAQDIAAFVAIWFENFVKFKGRAFHMAGESYGGRYIPVFAAAVYDQNAKLVEAGLTPVNLASIIIGNGMTEPYSMFLSYYDMQCTAASVPPVLDIGTCVRLKQYVPRCEKWLKEACVDQFDSINCGAIANVCEGAIVEAFYATGLNPYDISKLCDGPLAETLCYPATKHIRHFLDRPSVRTKLGVDPSITANFTSCSNKVGADFVSSMDMLHPSVDYVGALLDRGVRALIYVGTYDWICNWVGNERWTLALEWSGQEEFVKQPLREWSVGGDGSSVAGKTRAAKGLTFATVDAAGHMVPFDKPKESLVMIQRWLAGQPL